jgi:hypothetical protein
MVAACSGTITVMVGGDAATVAGPFADRHIAAGGVGPGKERLVVRTGDDAVAGLGSDTAFVLPGRPFAHGLSYVPILARATASAPSYPRSTVSHGFPAPLPPVLRSRHAVVLPKQLDQVVSTAPHRDNPEFVDKLDCSRSVNRRKL